MSPHSINEWQRETRLSQERADEQRSRPAPIWLIDLLIALMVLAVVAAFVLR